MPPTEDAVACVGALTYAADGRLLLIRRANDPGRGLWSLPGGRVEPGEDDATALVREMAEETGLVVEPGAVVGRVRRGRYEIADYRCTVVGGHLRAGDDALDARWCDAADLAELPLVEQLVETLAGWDALPGPPDAPNGRSSGRVQRTPPAEIRGVEVPGDDDERYVDRRQVMGEPSRQVDVGDRTALGPEMLRDVREWAAEPVHGEHQALADDHGARERGAAVRSPGHTGDEDVDHARLDR